MAQGGGMPLSPIPGNGTVPNNMQRPAMPTTPTQPGVGHGAMQFGPATPGPGGYGMANNTYGGPPPMSSQAQQWLQMAMAGASPQQFMQTFGGQPQVDPLQQIQPQSPAQGSMGFAPAGSDFLYRSQQRGLG